jgi:hypothetical protein
MIALRMPMRRLMTSTTGVMQLVVQLAQEIMRASPGGRLTP